jgi:hypothetical protein
MTTTSTGTTTTTSAAAPAAPTKLQHIGKIVELAGGAAFLAGTVLSAHHIAIGAFFVGGAAAFYAGRRLAKS